MSDKLSITPVSRCRKFSVETGRKVEHLASIREVRAGIGWRFEELRVLSLPRTSGSPGLWSAVKPGLRCRSHGPTCYCNITTVTYAIAPLSNQVQFSNYHEDVTYRLGFVVSCLNRRGAIHLAICVYIPSKVPIGPSKRLGFRVLQD